MFGFRRLLGLAPAGAPPVREQRDLRVDVYIIDRGDLRSRAT